MGSEYLVMGAKLECYPFGTAPGWLFVTEDETRTIINGRPQATVICREPGVNIMGFGNCRMRGSALAGGAPCNAYEMVLAERWDNTEKVKLELNGEKAITMNSKLTCCHGGVITPITSGQNCSELWDLLQFFADMEDMYPGLMDILTNPHASVFLAEGMREMALDFLRFMIDVRGGEMHLTEVLGSDHPADQLIASAIIKLTSGHGIIDQGRLYNHLENHVQRAGLRNGADPAFLDNLLLDVIRTSSGEYDSEQRWVDEYI